ncbi:hypothetical protein TanjilG_27864 [Lupinus angustifolius]|uniref:Rab-GAP TBC domain-containing protein n=2 Tax=Lupinus angustifolius TaxID=3871 RepID=A0A4P1RHY5_LUPAN|nr:hypothetical protein TanjilG_27864 [Lupinus angustifolius]
MQRLSNYAASSAEVLPEFLQVEAFSKLSNPIGKAGKTLSARKWHAAFSPEGYLDIGKTLSRIHRGGIHPSFRGEVWEFLLGCFAPKSMLKYAALKEECCHSFPLVGSGKFITAPVITEDGIPIQYPLVLLETDADNGVVAPAQDNNAGSTMGPSSTGANVERKENLSKLWDILAVYARKDTDVGYGQEYDPDLFNIYEDSEEEKSEESKGRLKSIRHSGMFERENMENGAKNGEEAPLPISVFLVASVLKEKSAILLQQARGLDDVCQDIHLQLLKMVYQGNNAVDNNGVVAPTQDNYAGSTMGPSSTGANVERVTDKKIIQWMLTLHQIGLDMDCTDRTLVFYEKKENLSKLWDILAVYARIDTDVGYGQVHGIIACNKFLLVMIMNWPPKEERQYP